MHNKFDLKEIEKKVFTTTHRDGLLDIFLGIILSQFSIAPLLSDIGFSDFEASAVFIPVWLLVFLLYFLMKRFVTKPRIGTIKPGVNRKSKMIKVNIILMIILFCGFIIGLFYDNFSFGIQVKFPIIFSIIILLTSTFTAFYLNLKRIYFYGILIAIAPITGEILWQNRLVSHHGFPVTFGLASLVLILTGSVLFFRFLKEYPVIKGE